MREVEGRSERWNRRKRLEEKIGTKTEDSRGRRKINTKKKRVRPRQGLGMAQGKTWMRDENPSWKQEI